MNFEWAMNFDINFNVKFNILAMGFVYSVHFDI